MIFLKYLLVFFLVLWLAKSVIKGILMKLFGPMQQQAFQQQRQANGQDRSGNIHVNRSPNKSGKNKTSDDFKGGDYIDYEEVD